MLKVVKKSTNIKKYFGNWFEDGIFDYEQPIILNNTKYDTKDLDASDSKDYKILATIYNFYSKTHGNVMVNSFDWSNEIKDTYDIDDKFSPSNIGEENDVEIFVKKIVKKISGHTQYFILINEYDCEDELELIIFEVQNGPS